MLVYNGYIMNVQAGEALALGDWVYIKISDGRAYKAQSSPDKIADGIMSNSATSGDMGQMYCSGIITDHPDTYTPGTKYYISGTAGDITSTKPESVGFQMVAVALDDNVLKITPGAWVPMNLKLVQEINFAEIDEDGGVTYESFSITGAAIGDPVVISIPTTSRITNVNIEAYVSNADEVTVKVTNNKPSTVNLDAAEYTIIVLK